MAFGVYESSLIGQQFQGKPEHGTESTRLVQESGIKWVKWINADSYAPDNPFRDYPQRVLARLYMERRDEEAFMNAGAAGAQSYYDTVRPRLERLASQGIFDVGGPNEPDDADDPERAIRHEAYWCRLIELYVHAGFTPSGWDFGNGHPGLRRFNDAVTVEAYATSIDLLRQAGGSLNSHEYNAPCVINPDGNNENSRTLRIGHTLDELSDYIDVSNLPVIIGECGITRAVLGGPDLGYLSYNQYVYTGMYGLPPTIMTEELYWLMMSHLDDEYRNKIPNIIAMLPFIACPDEKWKTHDWHGGLTLRAAQKHAMLPPPDPEPEPDPNSNVALVNAFIDRVPMTYKAALLEDLLFLGEIQETPTKFLSVCYDSMLRQYAYITITLLDGQWVIGETELLDRRTL